MTEIPKGEKHQVILGEYIISKSTAQSVDILMCNHVSLTELL